MFNWFRRNKPQPATQEVDIPPQIRKPQHAYRDARMSIPIGEREFYDIIQARKRSSLAPSVEGGKWKGKSRLHSGESSLYHAILQSTAAALAKICACLLTQCDEGVPSTTASSDWASHNSSSYGSKTSLTGGWAAAVAEEYSRQDGNRQGSTELSSLAESSRDAMAREGGE